MNAQTQASPAAANSKPPLWHPDIPIKVIGVTGPFSSGKSLFLATIAPQDSRIYDWEESLSTYRSLGFDYVSVYDRIPKGTKPVDAFRWFLNDLHSLPKGKHRVIGVDPISDVESGMVEHVASMYKDYGFKSRDSFERTGGTFWGAVRDFWKRELLDIGCECFAFSSHLRTVWKGNSPTSRKEPKGKATMMEIASLYLWLDRSPDANGKVPDKPSATVLKSRLAFTRINDNGEPEIIPALPPRLPVATPHAIREYLKNPPDYKKLKKGELATTDTMTEDERLQMQAEIAENNRLAEEARTARETRAEELRAMQQPQDCAIVRIAEARRQDAIDGAGTEETPTNGQCSMIQQAAILQLAETLGMTTDVLGQSIAKRTGSAEINSLTGPQADEVISILRQRAAQLKK